MKKVIGFKRILLQLTLLISITAQAQIPSYLLKITNEFQTGPGDYEFDVFILHTGSETFELANIGFGIGFDTTILNGGTPTFSLVSAGPAYCDLNSSQQPNLLPPVGSGVSTATRNVGGVIYRFVNVAPRFNPGIGNGTIINIADSGCTHPGNRIGRFNLHNSVPFTANSTCKHVFSTAISAGGISNTVISAYVGGLAVSIGINANNQSYLAGQTPATCTQNIVLNPDNLPIELVKFDAEINNEKVFVTWITASEINNDYFIVEKSKNARDWNLVDSIKGAGNSTTEHFYESIDEYPFQGSSYYRLKQVDFDGKISYSRAVHLNIESSFEINAYPNPSDNFFTLVLSSHDQSPCLFILYDATGSEIERKSNLPANGSFSFGENLGKGFYIAEVIQEGTCKTLRIMKN
jgi:hypothetical protein